MPEGGRGKLFESIDIAECVRIEPALMRAKPRCGHGVAFSIKQEGQVAYFFETAGSSNLASQQFHHRQQISFADSCVPVPNRIVRGSRLRLRPSLTRQHCPHSGTPNLAGMRRPLIDPITCELCRLAWSLHYSQRGTQNESTDQNNTHRARQNVGP